MKYLIILILLTMSCTDKKQIAEPIIAEVIEPEPIIEKAPEPNLPTATYQIDNSPFYSNQNLITVYYGGDSSFILWDPKKNQYYWIELSNETNNIQYTLDSQYQTITSLDSKIPYNTNIVFTGYSPLDEYKNSQYTKKNFIHGVYVNTNTSELYKAQIYLILDDGYGDASGTVYNIVEGTDHLPIYPTRRLQYPDGRYIHETYYTNEQGQVFNRNTYNSFGGLNLLNIKLSNNIILSNEE